MKLLSEVETANLLGVRKCTLQSWRTKRLEGLPYVKIGRLVKYRLADIENYINSQVVACLAIKKGLPVQREAL